MAKRFTENTKWEDAWFRKLSPKCKLFWLFIVDRCDIAGFWETDWELASFYIGENIDESIMNDFHGRLKIMPDGKIWIVKFVEFQYGKLNPAVHLHNSVINILEEKGLMKKVRGSLTLTEGLSKGSVRAKVKDKVILKTTQDTENIPEKENPTKEKFDFETFWNGYPKRGNKKVGKKECQDFIKQKIKPEEWVSLLKATKNYANSDECKSGYARDPIRFLKKDYWRDWIDVSGIPGKPTAALLPKFDEDKEFLCHDCRQPKPKAEREYGADNEARCRTCHPKYLELWKKENAEQMEKYQEDWKRWTPVERRRQIDWRKKFGLPILSWMIEEVRV